MAVVGIDLGSYSSYIAVARAGGIETIDNEYSARMTPTFVSFNEKNRTIGYGAKQQSVTNFKNTVAGFTRIVGRKFNDPAVQSEVKSFFRPNEVSTDKAGNAVIQVMYMGEKQSFTPEQLTGMMLSKLKHIAESALKTKVVDVVLSVPTYYTDAERHALLDACQMAGLNCLRLMNDTTAAALAYGIYKQDLPAETEKPRNVIIIDFGYSSMQTAACSFHKGKLKVVATSSDPQLGGRNFDEKLHQVFREEFKTKYKIDLETRPKPYLRMLQECEKLKKLMSANTQSIPINIECLSDDKDFKSRMERTQFEELSDDLLKRIESLLKDILEKSMWKTSDIYSVEIVGGSSRIPSFKKLVTTIFGKEPSTTLNSDEATSRGCALQCAILSPTFRVRDFHVTNSQPYPITLSWQGTIDEDSSLEVFPQNHAAPFSKMLTFYRKEPFSLFAKYTYPNNIPYPKPEIGTFLIEKVVPQSSGESSKVKVKVRIDSNGIFKIAQASMVEKLGEEESAQNEQMEVDDEKKNEEKKNGEANASMEEETKEAGSEETPMQTDDAPAGENSTEQAGDESQPMSNSDEKLAEGEEDKKKGNKKPKKTTRTVELPVQSTTPAIPKDQLNLYIEKENQMIMQDKLEKERADSKNAVEEYVYEMREKLSTTLEEYAKEEDRAHLSKLLEQTEDWLYDEGDDQNKQVYVDKLASLKKLGQPIVDRQREAQDRPQAFNEIGSSLQHVRKFLDMWSQKDEKYDHIDKSDVDKVQKCYDEKLKWYETNMNVSNNAKKYESPVVLVSQILQQKQSLESTVAPIMSKPKPKVEPPKEEKKEKKEGEKKEEAAPEEPKSTKQEPEVKPEMDVD
ncbi:heat shock 70 kDa protein 4-like [Haliotis cracherodii]|uniref:heat shock 70 kDa protein 4-like n=1 Tax=Haliotis cracherodii TaxID=6455 RepID=UPI0039EB1DA9